MENKFVQGAIQVIVAFVITWLLNAAVGYFFREKGQIMAGPPVKILNQDYFPIDISNFSNTPIENLQLDIPISSRITETVTTSPVSIINVPGQIRTAVGQRIELSGFDPNRITRVLIPIETLNDIDLIRIVNAESLGLIMIDSERIEYPVRTALENSFLPSISVAFIYAVALYFFARYRRQAEKMLDENLKRAERANEDLARAQEFSQQTLSRIDEVESKYKKDRMQLRAEFLKMKTVMYARIRDYSRELTFWRNTIRKLIYQTATEPVNPELLFKYVASGLKTQRNLNDDFVFDSFEALQEYFAENFNISEGKIDSGTQ